MRAIYRKVILLVTVGILLCITVVCGVVMLAYNSGSSLRVKSGKKVGVETQEYSVTMSPVGTVTFKHPPQKAVALDPNYNDILVAMNNGDKLKASGFEGNVFGGFYKQLPGFDTGIDNENLVYLNSISAGMFDKELLYKLDADVHHIDPLRLAASRGWSKKDVDEISRNVGPFFANRYSRENRYKGREPYEFYTLWELSEKVSEVYRTENKIGALKKFCDKLVYDIQSKLPPAEKRPKAALIYFGRGRITTYSLDHGGFGQAQYVAVGAQDAFKDKNIKAYSDAGVVGTALDVEGLLSVNPDVIIMPFAIYTKGARVAYNELLKLQDDPVASRIKAFRENHVYPGGTPLQGPVFYIFQIEMAAKQIYPEIFGKYRDDQNYPEAEWLFDRKELAGIITGKDSCNE